MTPLRREAAREQALYTKQQAENETTSNDDHCQKAGMAHETVSKESNDYDRTR